ncbi:MAG: NADH-quinone oxidoreductase subunit C [Nitrospinales bacterium]
MSANPLLLKNGQVVPLADVPVVSFGEMRSYLIDTVTGGAKVVKFFGHQKASGPVRVYAVLGLHESHKLAVIAADMSDSYESLTPECPQFHLFEREVYEQYGVKPEGHPWLKPVRYHPPYNGAKIKTPQIGVTEFFRVEGEEIHEVNVGPVHAGVIEPGCFRFQCHGEGVFHLEISLGYQHRGIEKGLVGGPTKITLPQMETIAGDMTVGHTTAYCQALEALSGTPVSDRAHAIRAIGLEIERMTCHNTDLGALALDVGYLPVAMFCGRLRAELLNSSAEICGSRFSRTMIAPGGVGWDIDSPCMERLVPKLKNAYKEICGAIGLVWDKPSMLTWFEGTGQVSIEDAVGVGLVGPTGRAAGIPRDVRTDYPTGAYVKNSIPISVADKKTGDVYWRAMIRWMEFQRSYTFIMKMLDSLPDGELRNELKPLAPNSFVCTLVEGWRGETAHVAITDDAGKFERYKIKDPSFHNWQGLSLALRGEEISHFPINNKSHNLSYCGYDL